MKKIMIIFLLALFIPVAKVEGYYCTYSEIARLKKIAANINVSYDYIEKNNSAIFSVTLVNLNREVYIVDATTSNTYRYNGDELTISNYNSGSTIQYYVYPVNSDCDDQLLYTIRLVLPSYNSYYKDEICKGIEEYTLCQKWSSHNLNYNEFKNRVTNYKESQKIEEKPNQNPDNDNDSLLHVLISLLVEYYYIILIVLILISSFGIYKLNKKSDIYN